MARVPRTSAVARSLLWVATATTVFAAVHSWLASTQAKAWVERRFGRRNRNGLYRVFYIAQSVATLAALGAFLWPLPDRVLYQARGATRRLMRAVQAAAFVYAGIAAYDVGLLRISGAASAWAWLRGDSAVMPEPEAQGPPLGPEGSMRVRGPFRFSRHPLNFAPLPIMWGWPRMTAKLLLFNLISTLYLVVGSAHEERRLRAGYGEPYAAYQASGIPFYVPGPGHRSLARARFDI
jgi:methanethiol S-methyltransferase